MTLKEPKDEAATVPERARPPRATDATVAIPLPTASQTTRDEPPAGGARPQAAASRVTNLTDSSSPIPLDSYQPAPVGGTVEITSPPPASERIVPSTSTVGSILSQVRRTPADRLEVESRIASGGMGAIDVAIDRALDRRIAIKTLHPHLRGDEAAVRMFLREARLTGLLDHPHIVPVYDLGEREGSSLFFAMKLVEGQTLAALIRSLPRGVLDTATLFRLLEIVTKVCDALAFAHSRGVIHCDVKPANVMVGEFGQVYLMDWGIARLVSTEAAPGSDRKPGMPATREVLAQGRELRHAQTDNSIIGTPGYMSPEQARGDRRQLDARSDVFLLGAMLYEILTHRPPYVCHERAETLALAAAGTFPSPRKVAGEAVVPLELDRIVMRAMAKDPDERYASVAELQEDLLRFMRGGAEFPRQTFRAGDVIVREGEPGDAAYILVEGACVIRKEGPDGARSLRTLGPGDVFGEMAILAPGPRIASVVAIEPTTVLVVTSEVLGQEMAALKPWIATLLTSLAERFRDVDTQNRNTHAASPSAARIANQVLMSLLTWGDLDPSSATGARSMKWTRLAAELEAQLGLPPVALFSAIARYGLDLDVEADRLTIPDPTALRERLAAELDLSP